MGPGCIANTWKFARLLGEVAWWSGERSSWQTCVGLVGQPHTVAHAELLAVTLAVTRGQGVNCVITNNKGVAMGCTTLARAPKLPRWALASNTSKL